MRIGLFGGTFDPIHFAHLLIAEQIREERQLDEIWFIPSHDPPHKKSNQVTQASHRSRMVEQAIANIPYFKISTIEFRRKGISYTYDTVKYLTEQNPNHCFFFIIGGDMIEFLPHWYRIEEIVELIQFIGTHRPGYQPDNQWSQVNVSYVEVPQIDISSSLIRNRIRNKQSIRFLVPESVRIYIEEKQLYES
jgi:nicotinate-nucleotide adenylyltransferase